VKKWIKEIGVGVLTGTLVTTSLWLAYPAKADTSSFLSDIHEAGFVNVSRGDSAFLEAGFSICTDLSNPFMNGEIVAENIYQNSQLSLPDARQFVVIAVEDLCPAYDHRNLTTM
jgi:hypothetical protein